MPLSLSSVHRWKRRATNVEHMLGAENVLPQFYAQHETTGIAVQHGQPSKIYNNINQGFSLVKPYIAPIPTYPRGLWSWTLAANKEAQITLPDSDRFTKLEDSTLFLRKSQLPTIFDLPRFYQQKLFVD